MNDTPLSLTAMKVPGLSSIGVTPTPLAMAKINRKKDPETGRSSKLLFHSGGDSDYPRIN